MFYLLFHFLRFLLCSFTNRCIDIPIEESRDVKVGYMKIPDARVKERRTKHTNVTVNVMFPKLIVDEENGNFTRDVSSGRLNLIGYVRFSGIVQIQWLKIVHSRKTIEMVCNFNIELISRVIQGTQCQ
ncbi:unnamed protein product [Vicia faba]|uniref:Late embryogenesis abundant protein n=1 Tax=Vicia faba TaxID=3906 RepID=A0AAV0YVU1_VICFA|nr:unnamed protein product [Vicia faba]